MGQGYLMDTNAIIDFLIGKLPNPAKEQIQNTRPEISVITHIELFSSSKTPPNEIQHLNAFVSVAKIYNVIDEQILRQAIDLRRKFKLKTPDAIIAATAIVNGLTLITRNVKDFHDIPGLALLNPWELT